MAVLHFTENNFKESVADKGVVLIDFWAPWCGPCRMISPIVDEVAEELTDVVVGKVNVDEQQDLAMAYNIRSIPTLVVLKDGKEIKRSLGVISKNAVKELVNC